MIEMRYRNWKQPKSKINDYKNKKHDQKHKDEMKSAKEDEKQLKKKKVGNKSGIFPCHTIKIKTKIGKIKWIEQFSKTILFGGKPADFITLIDITERKINEEKIKRHLELEKTAAEISELIVKTEDIDKGLNKALSMLGSVFEVDHVYLFQHGRAGGNWQHQALRDRATQRERLNVGTGECCCRHGYGCFLFHCKRPRPHHLGHCLR